MTKKSYGEAILTPKAEGISRVSRDLLIVLRDVTYSLALLGNFVRFAHSASLVFSLRLFPSFVVKGASAKHAFGIHHSRSQDTFD